MIARSEQFGRSSGRPQVLLLTSHPIDGRDGADKEIALSLVTGLDGVDLTFVARAGGAPILGGHSRLSVLSRRGLPGTIERAQVAVRAVPLSRRADLVHVVMTVGPQFPGWSRSRLRPHGRPTLHTVPGIARTDLLSGIRPFDVTVTLAESTAQALRDAGFPDVRVVPPGIDLTRWRPRPRPAARRPVLLFAGHFGPDGGTEQALQAAAAAERSGQPVRLVLALRHRSGHHVRREAQAVLARASALGLEQVAVHHRVDDMTALVGEADVVLYLPLKLTQGKADVPLTILEALGMGRPVVATDLPQLAGLGTAVSRVSPGDHEAAAAAVTTLLRSPAHYDAAATQGTALVVERFSAQTMCARYAEIYAELLAGRGLGRQPGGIATR